MIPLAHLGPHSRPDTSVVAVQGARTRTWAEFRAAVGGAAERLAGAARVVLACDDGWHFATRLFGALAAGAEVVLPANGLPATLAGLDGVLVDDGFDPGMGEWTRPLPADARLVFRTSGSSGEPKAVVRTLAQLGAEVAALHALWGDGLDGAPVLATVPHHHAYGLIFKLLWPLAAGRPFHAAQHALWEDVLAALPAGALLVTSPAHLGRMGGLAALPPERRPRMVLSAGAPLAAAAGDEAARVLGCAVTEIYGSTETGAVAFRRGGAAWTPLPGYGVSAGESGLLRLDSPAGRAEVADRIELAAGGRFRLLGRADRIAKIAGKRVSLDEVERRLRACAEIEAAAAVVLDGAEPELAAVAVLSADGRDALDRLGRFRLGRSLRQALSRDLEAAALPRRWRFVAELPHGPMGKCRAADLAALFADAPRLPAVLLERCPGDGVAELDLLVPADLFWFRGHFPGRPILPGVVQMDWAVHYGRSRLGLALPAAREFQIKFKAMIVPGDRLRLALRHDAAKGRLAFAYRRGDEECSSGTVFL